VQGAALFLQPAQDINVGGRRHCEACRQLQLDIGGANASTNRVSNIWSTSAAVKNRPDWIGLAISAIGLVTALPGLFNSVGLEISRHHSVFVPHTSPEFSPHFAIADFH
jgi:hypothetical protein